VVPPASARAPRLLRLTQVLAPHKKRSLRLRDSHPLRWIVPDHFCFALPLCEISPCEPYNPAPTWSAVWATPLSLAATYGISFDFSSSRYLDVSVPWVGSLFRVTEYYSRRVSPFGHPWIKGCVHLGILRAPLLRLARVQEKQPRARTRARTAFTNALPNLS
jgi:hypothetical protein